MYPHPFDYSYNLVMQGLNWAGAMLAKLGWAKQFVALVFHWTAWGLERLLSVPVFVVPVSPLDLKR